MLNIIVMATLAGAPVSSPPRGAPLAAPLPLVAPPVVTENFKLDCPAGTKQVRTDAKVACQEGMRDGIRVFHGPYVSLYPSGAVEAVGQTDHGFRSGKWSFYDLEGTLVGETEFKRGNFDGRRVFYAADGRVKSEERYLSGRLIAPVAAPRGVTRSSP